MSPTPRPPRLPPAQARQRLVDAAIDDILGIVVRDPDPPSTSD